VKVKRFFAGCAFAAGIAVVCVLAGCESAPPSGPLRLAKVGFADLPAWENADAGPAFAAFLRSCGKMAAKDVAAPMGGAGYAGSVGDWRPACEAAAAYGGTEKKRFFEEWFAPVAVSAGRAGEGLFTGYYEPEISVSRTRHDGYQTPVYGVPPDLVAVDLGAFRPALKGERIAGKVENGRLVPYASRAEIDAEGVPGAPVLFYAADPVDLFFLQIQGSGRALSDDGTVARLSYGAQNGYPYTAIGGVLVARGALKREEVSLAVLRAWLSAHPAEARNLMEQNDSYVFFREEPLGDASLGASGAEGVPLTAFGSMAVDTRIHPLGVPFFVATDTDLKRLSVAQDRGGAIRGIVRADLYFGAGAKAEAAAGPLQASGRLYALLPKPVAAKMAVRTDYPEAAP
jgi:membrane-bound lytic murein transglycosylase A